MWRPKRNKMTRKTPQNNPNKIISRLSDLEKIKPMENVEVNYPNPLNPAFSRISREGIYAGSFAVNNEKYFVVSNVYSSNFFRKFSFLTSHLYTAPQDNQSIKNMMESASDNCNNDLSDLETGLKNHLEIFNKSKLNDLQNNK